MTPPTRSWPLAAVGLLLGLCATSCIATGARLRVGPVIDSDGRAAVQADLGFGLGYATTDHAGVLLHPHVGGGSRDRLTVGESVEYARFSDGYGWRGGGEFQFAPLDDRLRGWVVGAVTYPLRSRYHSGGHEKMEHTTSTGRWSIGIEGRAGVVSDDLGDDDPGNDLRAASFGLAATLEWTVFSRMRL